MGRPCQGIILSTPSSSSLSWSSSSAAWQPQPAHMFLISAQLRLTCHTSTRWTLTGFDILCLSHMTKSGWLWSVQSITQQIHWAHLMAGREAEGKKGWDLSLFVVTYWSLWLRASFNLFNDTDRLELWLQSARIYLI